MDNRVGYNDQEISIDKNVAIVGIGCRYPNDINNVRDFWKMLKDGLDCTKCHPKDRLDPSFIYPNEKLPGKIYCRAAGYLSQNLTGFDRLFFQMSPDEADYMDPQLRLLLEVVWESLEDYGVNIADLRQSDTGVYVGVMSKEYYTHITVPDVHINKYTASGNNSNMMSNRISYQFDFQGPSITYDTACSSSMYAIHHACEAIRNGDCNLALAGGVNLFLLPSTFVALCQAGMLSPDGKCKSFDSSADGYARGEGAGIVVLKPLKQAIKHGDRIYAVIRGGTLNNDGKTSGITAPSTQSQILLLKRAYKIANVSPQEVPYVEAHGTGTQAGDTAEATALGSVMGNGRGENHPPLIVGSVKSNFGHTEGAAGVAGVIKTSLVLKNKQIPKILHFRSKNENVNWNRFEMTFPTYLMDWPKDSKYLAGCSSFGFGGANAHLVLEAAPTMKKSGNPNNKYLPALLLISAASKDALNQRASDWLKFLSDSSDNDFWDIVRTAATRATHHAYRLAICCQSLEHSIQVITKRQNSPAEAKDMFAEGRVQTLPSDQKQKLVFVFSGMGTQWWGMGRQLMKVNPVFKKMITKADKFLKECGASWSLEAMLTTETNREQIHDTAIAQPSICALQIAVAEVYRQLGILPHAVIGHSVGEVAAACVAGYITFRDAMRLIYIRGKLLKRTSGKGTMAAIFLQASKVRDKLSEPQFHGKIDIACVNSPTQTVISGNVDAVKTFIGLLKSQGVRCVHLKVQNAFHSFQQEEVKTTFLKATGTKFLQYPTHYGNRKHSPRQVPMVSTVNGEFLTSKDLNNNQYWWQNIRQTVEFEKSLRKLFENGYSIFLEIGAHPSLAPALKNTMDAFSDSFETSFHENYAVIGSLRRPADLSLISQDDNNLVMSIAKLYVQGYSLNLEMLFPDDPFNIVSLPTYPWQRQQCVAITDIAKGLYITPRVAHPLLGESLVLYHDESDRVDRRTWKSSYNLASLPWLQHHKIENVIILPGAAYIEMMLTVAKQILEEPRTVTLENVHFHKFHDSPECKGSLDTNAVKSRTSSQWQIAVRTFNEDNQSWGKNASCSLNMSGQNIVSDKLPIDKDEIKKTWKEVTNELFYKKLAENGIDIGNMFRSVSSAFYNFKSKEGLVYATLPKAFENELIEYVFHPSLLDAAFQLVNGFSFEKEFGGIVEVPKFVENVTVKSNAPSSIVIYGQEVMADSNKSVNLAIANSEDGKIFATLENVQFAALGSKTDLDVVQAWEKEWTPVSRGTLLTHAHDTALIPFNSRTKEDYLILSDDVGVTDIFHNSLIKAGISPGCLKVCNISNDTDIQTFCKQGEHTQNIIVLTFMNDANFRSLNDISREQFFRSQINDPMSLVRTIIDLHSKSDTSNLSIWVITKGAVRACKSDLSVNPLMSSGYSMVMNFMNEFPKLAVTNLDLPIEQSIEDSVRWLSTFFLQPERSENFLALRPRNNSSNDDPEFDLFSLRLKIKPTSSFSCNKKSDNWMIDISRGIKSIRLKPTTLSTETEISEPLHNSEISIQVKAFIRQYRKTISTSAEHEVGFLFGGSIQKSENFNKNLRIDQNVLGYKRCHMVTSVVKSKPFEVVPIPLNVSISEALFIVQSYFALYLSLQETFKMTEEQVVMITSDNTNVNLHLAFGKQITSYKGINVVKVIIYVQTAGQETKLGTNHGNVTVTTAESLQTEVADGSVDTLVIHSDFVVKNKEAETLFSKVRFYGTIASLGDAPVADNVIKARQIGVRVVEPDHMWAYDNNDLTNQLIDSLLKLFINNGYLNEAMNHVMKQENFKEVIENQATDDKSFDIKIWQTKPTYNVSFDYKDAEQLFSVDSTSAYLVVGGTKGFGAEIARWLVSQGAMSVYISGRNAPKKHILQELNKMRKQCSVEYIQCDITNEKDTEKMLLHIRSKGLFPLSIFHCAAVFEDQRLENMSEEAWAKVLFPKAYGLLLLHQFSTRLKIPIQEFVTISSIVQYLGNAGQGNYCSANTFLHSICQERRLKNLPATVIAPGAIGEVGYAARKGFDKVWENRGMRSLSPSEVIHSLLWSLGTNSHEFGFTGALNRETFMKGKPELFQHEKERNRFSIFKNEFSQDRLSSTVTSNSSNSFASINATEATLIISKFFNDFLRQRLGLSEDISKDLPLSSFGFDSAMSWELSSLIRSEFNVVVSSVELLNDSAKISNISSIILSRASKKDANENVSASRHVVSSNTLWLHEPRELKTSRANLFCFPPTGKGSTLFAEWGDLFARQGIRVIVAQLPGWEGRENEQASHDLGFLVKSLSDAIISRSTSTRVGFFGSGIGSLLAFEIARYLQAEHNITINHIYISGWYPPSSPYPYSMELNELDKKRFTIDNDEEKSLTFLDNRDIRQVHVPRKAFLNIKASESICKSYKYFISKPLQCNMTMFSGVRDTILTQKVLGKWKNEIDPGNEFDNVTMPTDHKLMRNKKCNEEIASHVIKSLLKEKATSPFNREAITD